MKMFRNAIKTIFGFGSGKKAALEKIEKLEADLALLIHMPKGISKSTVAEAVDFYMTISNFNIGAKINTHKKETKSSKDQVKERKALGITPTPINIGDFAENNASSIHELYNEITKTSAAMRGIVGAKHKDNITIDDIIKIERNRGQTTREQYIRIWDITRDIISTEKIKAAKGSRKGPPKSYGR